MSPQKRQILLNFCDFLCFFENKNVFTIDKYQGSEHDVIILILDPINNNQCQMDPNRLNVALTRAKQKLFIIGNQREMLNSKLFYDLLNYSS